MKVVDPVTHAPLADTFTDVWRMVPTVNDVKLTGPDGQTPWPRGVNRTGGYQLDARVATLQEQALGALTNHAQVQFAPAPEFLDDLHSFQRVLFTNNRVRALADAIDEGVTPLPDPDPALNALERRGKAVFTRACTQCHGSPTQSVTQADVNFRYHDIFTECPRPVDAVTPPRFAFAPCPPRLARNARTYEITLLDGTQGLSHQLRSRPRAADGVRVAPSGAAVHGRLEQVRCPCAPRDQQDRPLFPQQQRGHARGRRGPLCRDLQVHQGHCSALPSAARGRVYGRRALRSNPGPGGDPGAARLPAKAAKEAVHADLGPCRDRGRGLRRKRAHRHRRERGLAGRTARRPARRVSWCPSGSRTTGSAAASPATPSLEASFTSSTAARTGRETGARATTATW